MYLEKTDDGSAFFVFRHPKGGLSGPDIGSILPLPVAPETNSGPEKGVHQVNPFDIQAALRKAGLNQTAIAARLRVSRQAVTRVVHGQSRSIRIEREISRITGLALEALWPERYDQAA